MPELNAQQKKRAKNLTRVVEKGKFGILEHLTELEEKIDEVELETDLKIETAIALMEQQIPDLSILKDVKGVQGEQGQQGEKGDTGEKGEPGRDGINGKDGRDGRDGREGVDGSKGEDGKDGSPDTPKEVRDKLETLKGDDRLDVSAIKGITKRLTKFGDDLLNRAISILDQRTSFLINKVSNLQTQVNNLPTGGTGSGITFETPVGTVDGSNTTFTVTQTPKFIVADGTTYFENNGYTLSGLTVTMTSPPVLFIRSAY